ncbi:MAG: DUF3370 domain-containing protein, partial [Cyanothece sp. SIO1E1]|nr:DUF3370 domain-containing protein [Cyanothece sp. SIO1E1]
MLSWLLALTLAQAAPTLPPQELIRPQGVRPLPRQLDAVPVFNSNSPELIQTPGILLSTFPSDPEQALPVHLNFPFQGRFDLFAHHVAKALSAEDLRTLYLGIIVHNPGPQPVILDILQAASYLSVPDAPFIELPPWVENSQGEVYSGPGSRAMDTVLRGQRQDIFPAQLIVPPRQHRMLLNLPIPVSALEPPLNGRSTLMRLRSHGQIYVASLAQYAPVTPEGDERPPTLAEWQMLLATGALAGPRDRSPTPIEATTEGVIYGRVAGVAQGSEWRAILSDHAETSELSIPLPGQAFSYGLSTLHVGRLGTGQIQSAPLLVRYPDTAYQAHGNYGVQYSLTLPLFNPTDQVQTVTVALQTPIKEDQLATAGLRFFAPPPAQVFFRGTVRIRYTDDQDTPKTRYVHLVQKRG